MKIKSICMYECIDVLFPSFFSFLSFFLLEPRTGYVRAMFFLPSLLPDSFVQLPMIKNSIPSRDEVRNVNSTLKFAPKVKLSRNGKENYPCR